MPGCSAMILAATGEERMRSSRPKPVHLLCGRPMVQYVLDALGEAAVDRIVVVVGSGLEQVSKKITEVAADPRIVFAEHAGAHGPAEAALRGLEAFADDVGEDDILVLPGNAPLLQAETVADLLVHHRTTGASATVLAVPVAAGSSFRRIVEGRDPGSVAAIEPRFGDEPALEVAALVDTAIGDTAPEGRGDHHDGWLGDGGVYCFRRSLLAPALRRLRPDPETGLFRLSDAIEVLASAGHRTAAYQVPATVDAEPVDDRVQLASAEAAIRQRINLAWMRRGVTMVDPDRTYIDATVRLAPDVTLFPNTMLQGATAVGPGAEIGPDTRLVDCAVGARARVEKAMGREAEIGDGALVGPFAVLDPGSYIGPEAVTGPFYHVTE